MIGICSNAANGEEYADYIKLGIDDNNAKARLGLAVGLKDSFSSTLVPMVLDWFTREMDGEIRPQILDHLIRQAERSQAYKQHALSAFELGSADARDRMLATAAGSPLFSEFSSIKYSGRDDLLRGEKTVTNNNTYNIGNIQAGAVSLKGDATQVGNSSHVYNAQTLELIQSRLTDAEREVKISPADVKSKKDALQKIATAKKNQLRTTSTKLSSRSAPSKLWRKRHLGSGPQFLVSSSC